MGLTDKADRVLGGWIYSVETTYSFLWSVIYELGAQES